MIHYAVTEGDYSDYHIVTICSDKQKAENIAKIFDDAIVEEFDDGEVNDGVWFELNFDSYEIKAEPLGGTFYPEIETLKIPDDAKMILDDDTHKIFIEYTKHYDVVRFYIKAFDKETAIKAGADMYAAYRAFRNGV